MDHTPFAYTNINVLDRHPFTPPERFLRLSRTYLVGITIEWGAYPYAPLDGDGADSPGEMEALFSPLPSRGPWMARSCSRSPKLLTHISRSWKFSVDCSLIYACWTFMVIAHFCGQFHGWKLTIRSSCRLLAFQCSVMSLSMEFTSTDPRSPTAHDVPSSHWFPARTTTILRHTPHLQSSQTLEAFILDRSGPLRTTGE